MTLAILILTFVAEFHYVKAKKTVEYDLSGGVTRVCFKRTDDDACPPDHQIEACEANYEKVRCVPCPSGLRQCDKSTSALYTKCYDPSTFCPADENVLMVVNQTAGGCKILCRCNEAQGYSGLEPHHCDNNRFPCQPTHHRVTVGGECFPCPSGYHNPWDDGVDRCVEKTSTRTSLPVHLEGKTNLRESTTSKPRIDSTVLLVDTLSKDVVIKDTKLTDVPVVNSDFNIDKINEKSGDTIHLSWTVIVLSIVIGIICLLVAGALFFYFCYYRPRQRKDKAVDVDVEVEAFQTELTGDGATGGSAIGGSATGGSATGNDAEEDSASDPRQHEESIPLMTNASGGEESRGTSLEISIQTAAGWGELRTKLLASKPLCTVQPATSTSNQSVAQARNSSLCSSQCEECDVHDELYRLIKRDFCGVVDPTQLVLFLDCGAAVDERVTEIQKYEGRCKAAHQLLLILVKERGDWARVLCTALRSRDLKLEHLADSIEEKQRQLSRTEVLCSGPEAIVCQEEATSFSSLQRKQQTHKKEVN